MKGDWYRPKSASTDTIKNNLLKKTVYKAKEDPPTVIQRTREEEREKIVYDEEKEVAQRKEKIIDDFEWTPDSERPKRQLRRKLDNKD